MLSAPPLSLATAIRQSQIRCGWSRSPCHRYARLSPTCAMLTMCWRIHAPTAVVPHSGLARVLLRLVVDHFVRSAQDFGQPIRVRQHVGILVERADAPGMGAGADLQPHSPVFYKDCAGHSGLPEVVCGHGDPAELAALAECGRAQRDRDFRAWLTEVATSSSLRRLAVLRAARDDRCAPRAPAGRV